MSGQVTPPGDQAWIEVLITAPLDTGLAVVRYLLAEHGFRDVDWSVMEREDLARAEYGPCPPRTANEFLGVEAT